MKILAALLLALAALVSVLGWNTLALKSPAQAAAVAAIALDEMALAQRLAGAVRIQTISLEDRSAINPAAFDELAAYLRTSFPRTHATLKLETVNAHSLLYTWPGRDTAAKPVLLLAHLDVVPVEPGTETRWTHPPFSGAIADGYIWGRGTLDDKNGALAQLEAIEHLLAEGYSPARTIYLAFGHDEEIGGEQGAQKIAALLKSRGIKAEFALDEGGAITQGVIAGLKIPVASIMGAEKGYLSLRLTTRAAGGHSSMPPTQTAAGQLARAVARVQDSPLPARITPAAGAMLGRLAPDMSLTSRVAIANRWLFEPLLLKILSSSPVSNALIRTTTAPTLLRAGIKDNVLPSEASAVINFRLLPGDSVASVEQHLRELIADEGVEITREPGFAKEASAVSPVDTAGFALLEQTVNEVFPAARVSTGIVLGATDLRNYADVFEQRYNFSPTLYHAEDLARLHGTDERISIAGYADSVRFYLQLLRKL